MAYRSGKVEGSHQLSHIIRAMMLEEGWTVHKSLQADGYDNVFYSMGSDGYQDIYVRVGAGMYDYNIEGDIQMPRADGYTGYLNFLVYQSWDAAKDGTDGGNNEIGRTGPVVYIMPNDGAAARQMTEYNLMTSTDSVTKSRVIASAIGWIDDITTASGAWDGHSKSYHHDSAIDLGGTSTTQMYQFDMRRGYYNRAIWYPEYESIADDFLGFVVRRKDDSMLVYHINTISNELEDQFHVFDQDNFDDYRRRYFAPSPYSEANTSTDFLPGGFLARGPVREGDGEGLIYMGDDNDSNWFAYDIAKDDWGTIKPFDETLTPVLPFTADSGNGIVVLKEISGYDHDRLYVLRADTTPDFASIALDENGAPTGVWTTHDDMTANLPTASGMFVMGNHIVLNPGAITLNGEGLYKWQIPSSPTDAGTWEAISTTFFAVNPGNGATVNFHHHLSSRVRIREREGNNYWAFVDEDRVVVVTRTNGTGLAADDRYHYAYAGLFNTYHDKRVTTLTTNAASSSATLSVANTSIFKIDEPYVMIDVTGARQTLQDTIGNDYNMAPSVSFTVTGISRANSTITIDPVLPRDFFAGSKIGEDPQPVGVRREKTDQFYTVNNLNAENDHLSRDPAWQWYNLRELHQSDPNHGDRSFDKFRAHNMSYSLKENARTRGSDVTPAIIYLGDQAKRWDTPSGVNLEIRGSMIDLFYCSTEFEDESIIVIDGKKYIVFGIYESDLAKIAVGPIEE